MPEDQRGRLSKAQCLEVAGYVAPVLRDASPKTLARRITLYDAETGEVTGYATGAEALRGLAKIQDLELSVEEGVRPATVVCELCGKPFVVGKAGKIPTTCPGGCSRQTVCAGVGCIKKPPAAAFHRPAAILRRGRPWMCMSCQKRASRRGRVATCHPDKPHEAKGMCKLCYRAARRRITEASAHDGHRHTRGDESSMC